MNIENNKTKEELLKELQELRQTTWAWSIQYAITRILAETPSLALAIPQILQIFCIDLGWELGFFWKVDEKKNLLFCKGVWAHPSFTGKEFINQTLNFTFESGVGFAGIIWKTGNSKWIMDMSLSNLPRAAAAKSDGLHSGFGLPILLGSETLGVLEFFTCKKTKPDDRSIHMLEAIGSQIGQFIERKEAEEALKDSQEQLELALAAAHMGYWTWEVDQNITHFSSHFDLLCGKQNKCSGNFDSFLSCVHPADREFVKQTIFDARKKESSYNIEFRIVWEDGNLHWIASRGKFFRDSENHLKMIGVGLDIDTRKASEEKLKIAYDEMEKRVVERTLQLSETNQKLNEEILERKKVEKDVLEISQKEQRRLGMELHDGICQELAGINMIAQVLSKQMEAKHLSETAEVKKISHLVKQTLLQARDMARGLFPVELESESLMVSLKELTSKIQSLLGISCNFECPQPILITDNNIATHLYRIAQEAMNNAIKHGKAQNIRTSLTQDDGKIILKITDDGIGQDVNSQTPTGIGMHIMKYRARMIDAELTLIPNTNQGMLLTCIAPYSEA